MTVNIWKQIQIRGLVMLLISDEKALSCPIHIQKSVNILIKIQRGNLNYKK